MGVAFQDFRVAPTTVSPRPEVARRDSPSGNLRENLPGDVSFLGAYLSSERALRVACRNARQVGVATAAALLAQGGISETLYFFTLSHDLGTPFVWGWPNLSPDADAARALASGQVGLADGTLLIAPSGAALGTILAAGARRSLSTCRLAIATPGHLAALVCRHLPNQIAELAGCALANASPHLSARGAAATSAAFACLAAAFAGLIGLLFDLRLAIDVVSVTVFAALVFRLLVCAMGLSKHPVACGLIDDKDAPIYTVLVPLRDEAAMVPGLLAALESTDYPRAKLEILFLTEADDRATRVALLAADLPPHMRVVVVPNGEPRTKPRALNAGLLMARGALVTVYDAEDRPDPDQLRRAAWRFAHGSDDLACLQARLTISNGADGLIPRAIMEHPPQAA